MIRIAALQHMLLLETAAGNWFTRLGEPEKKAYLAAHPKSKFHSGTPTPIGEHDHASHILHHRDLSKYHNSVGQDGIAEMHDLAAQAHDDMQHARGPGMRDSFGRKAATATKKANMATRKSIYDDDAPAASVPEPVDVPTSASAKKLKLSYKRDERVTGLQRAISTDRGSTVRVNGKDVGSITTPNHRNGGDGKWGVMLRGRAEKSEDNPAGWKNVMFKARHDSEPDARAWLEKHIHAIHEKHRLHDVDDAPVAETPKESAPRFKMHPGGAIEDREAPPEKPAKTPKLPKGVKIADNGIELHPIEHPESWGIGGSDKGVAYAMHKNGVHIGNVHNFVHEVTHMIPGSRLASHRTRHVRMKLSIPNKHLLPKSFVRSIGGYKTLKAAVQHAGEITHGANVAAVPKGAIGLDHAAEAKYHAGVYNMLKAKDTAHGARYAADKFARRRGRQISNALYTHQGAMESHQRAMEKVGTPGYAEAAQRAMAESSAAHRATTALGMDKPLLRSQYHPEQVTK